MKNAIAKQAEINQELTTLIDDDLKQEQELLKALIKEILEANEKIKNAHFERVEDTEAKLKVLNSEVQRIRRTIKKQDDVVTKKRLELLSETKDQYFETLAEMRLSDAKEHFANPLRKHLADLKRSFSQIFKDATTPLQDFSAPVEQYLTLMTQEITQDFNVSERTLEDSYTQLTSSQTTIQEALEPLKGFADTIFKTFKHKLDTLLGFFDTSELDDLVDDIESTKATDLSQLADQEKVVNDSLNDEIERLNDTFEAAKAEAFKDALAANNHELSDANKALYDSVVAAEHASITASPNDPAYKELRLALKQAQKAFYRTLPGKIAKKVDKSFKAPRKQLDADKLTKRVEHLEQSYEIRMQHKERQIQALIDIASLKMRTLLTYLENQEETLLETFEFMERLLDQGYQFELSVIALDQTIQMERFQAYKRAQEFRLQKADVLKRYQRLVQKLEVETLNHLHAQHGVFEDIQLQLDFTLNKERLEINRLYGLHKILDKRVQFIGKSKVKRMDELKDLKFQLFQDEADIALAEKEYDIQVLKAQSLYDHEKAINKVQSERIDAGVRVNKAMVQATVKRQVNFADQQIKFAEAEHAARMEHIEYTLNQELSYTEETLGYHEKNYEAKRKDMQQEYESKLHSIRQKKKLFEHSPMLKKVIAEEKDINDAYADRVAEFDAQLANDETIKRYREQIQKAHDHADKARRDATALRDENIESFTELKNESLARLANVEKMMAGPDLLPYHDEKVNDQASERLQDMLNTAENFLHEKIEEPKVSLAAAKERIIELEKGDLKSSTVEELAMQEKNLNASFTERMAELEHTLNSQRALKASKRDQDVAETESILAAIDKELAAPLATDRDALNALNRSIAAQEKTLETTHEQLRSERLMKKNERLNGLARTQSKIKDRMVDVSVKTQMKVEKIETLQSKAVSESYKKLHKQFKKDKKAL